MKPPFAAQATIKERLGRYAYRERRALLADLDLMRDNARLFNGADNPLAHEATAMVDAARAACDAVAGQLDVLEKETRDQTALSSRRPQPGSDKWVFKITSTL